MSRLGLKSLVYHGDALLGELDTVPVDETRFRFPNNEIRIQRISANSERCPPLSVLQAISSASVRCKLESSSPVEQANLINLHASCFYEMKTAVVMIGEDEIHLVAMPSKLKKFPCFWCYSVPSGLYMSCLGMLNMRCLSIVFDLDETLIVANTMKSFEDRMEALRCWIAREADPIRSSGMTAEHKRCAEDRLLLKQYMESDYVMDNGKVLKAQFEEASLDNPERVRRPVIRLPEKNVVLTRINPEIRDTSILVRLRPAWDDLKSYLIAKGRKRFEVYVCTMAERDYALEMWRLLDPEGHLIGQKQLIGRVVCVKSGFKKSLLNVFQNGICHPKMAMVIDDRAKVWEDIDQPRVHVVPPFTPYFAPQAETANAVPVLCVARNVACNVRGGFFKEFDENFIRRISELFYEDEVVNLPSAPDVSNYLMSEIYEEGGFLQNGNTNAPIAEGMSGAEVEQRLNQSGERNVLSSTANSMESISDLRTEPAVPSIMGSSSFRSLMPSQKPSVLGAPVRHDGMKQGDPPILCRVPAQPSVPFIQPQGGWLVDEEIGRGYLNNRNPGFAQEIDAVKIDMQRANYNLFSPNSTSAHFGLLLHPSQVKGEEASAGHEWKRQHHPAPTHSSEVAVPHNQVSSTGNSMAASLSIGVLHEIGRRCSSKVEFRSVISTSKDLQFSVEVLFTGEKIGFGMGKTRKDAQQQAAENALHSLADKYVAHAAPSSGAFDNDFHKLSLEKENGFLWETINSEINTHLGEDGLPNESPTESSEAVQMDSSSNAINQAVQKRASSPRLQQSVPNKRTKEEPFHNTQNHSSSRFQKNGNPLT